jgi:hypothetical protein
VNSLFDRCSSQCSDIMMISIFIAEGQTSFAVITGAMIAINMILQLAFTLTIYTTIEAKLRNAFYVLSLVKPIVDAYRVAAGVESDDSSIDTLMEVQATKIIELFGECIPALALQTYAVLSTGSSSWKVIMSIVISAITTGFTSASISYDFDTTPSTRRKLPGFYGYVPDQAWRRMVCFVCLMASTSLVALVRSITVACVLIRGGSDYVAALLLGEMALYLLYKAVRGDMLYWIKIPNKLLHVFCSVMVRGERVVWGYPNDFFLLAVSIASSQISPCRHRSGC